MKTYEEITRALAQLQSQAEEDGRTRTKLRRTISDLEKTEGMHVDMAKSYVFEMAVLKGRIENQAGTIRSQDAYQVELAKTIADQDETIDRLSDGPAIVGLRKDNAELRECGKIQVEFSRVAQEEIVGLQSRIADQAETIDRLSDGPAIVDLKAELEVARKQRNQLKKELTDVKADRKHHIACRTNGVQEVTTMRKEVKVLEEKLWRIGSICNQEATHG